MSAHILFVDDEIPIRETLSMYFKIRGFQVTTAENRDEALRFADKGSFDLAILDVDLGGENGLELLEVLKRTQPKLPIIMFTSLGYDPALLEESLRKGASGYMSKTESLDTLMKEVQRALQPKA